MQHRLHLRTNRYLVNKEIKAAPARESLFVFTILEPRHLTYMLDRDIMGIENSSEVFYEYFQEAERENIWKKRA